MIHKVLVGIVLNGLALYLVTKFMPEIAFTGGIKFYILGGLIIGILNTFVKPLMKILSFPFVLMTAGLFILVINAIIFWLTVKIVNVISIFDITVTVTSPWTYLIAAVVFGVVNWVLHLIIHNK